MSDEKFWEVMRQFGVNGPVNWDDDEDILRRIQVSRENLPRLKTWLAASKRFYALGEREGWLRKRRLELGALDPNGPLPAELVRCICEHTIELKEAFGAETPEEVKDFLATLEELKGEVSVEGLCAVINQFDFVCRYSRVRSATKKPRRPQAGSVRDYLENDRIPDWQTKPNMTVARELQRCEDFRARTLENLRRQVQEAKKRIARNLERKP